MQYRVESHENIHKFQLLHWDIKETYAFIAWRFIPEIQNFFWMSEFYKLSYQKMYEVTKLKLEERTDRIYQSIVSKLEPTYDLVYVGPEDFFLPEQIQEFIEDQSFDSFHTGSWINEQEWESASDILLELLEKDNCLTREEVYWMEDSDNEYYIREAIYDRNISTPLEDTLRNTNVNVRVTLFSDYDTFPWQYEMNRDGYKYEDMFAQIVDTLNLNPMKLHFEMHMDWMNVWGPQWWPDISDRDWKEYVSYEDFISELKESIGNCNNLTFLAKLNGLELTAFFKDGPYTLTIPAWNKCGLFDHVNGSGSQLDCTLLRDFTVPLTTALDSEYDFYKIIVDDTSVDKGYSIDQTYWMVSSVFGKDIILTPIVQ